MTTGQDQVRVAVAVDVAESGGQGIVDVEEERRAKIGSVDGEKVGRFSAGDEDVGNFPEGEDLDQRSGVGHVLGEARGCGVGSRRIRIDGDGGAVIGMETVGSVPVDGHLSF